MIITEEQEKKLREILPHYEKILETGGFRELLIELGMEITAAFDKNDDTTPRSREIERLYDELYYQN